MLICIGCKYNVDCTKVFRIERENCTEYRPRTNADRMRAMAAMTDEELAKAIDVVFDTCPTVYKDVFTPYCTYENGCHDCWLDWLKQEVNDEN